MTKRIVRGYAAALSLFGFSAAWVATSQNPFPQRQAVEATAQVPDPRIAALDARAADLRRRAAELRRIVAARADIAQQTAAAPRIVSAPAVTQTSTS